MVAWIAVEVGVSLGFMIGDYIYHRITDEAPTPKEVKQFQTPTVEEGAPIPMIYGRCRVRTPILAWHGRARSDVGDIANGSPDVPYIYLMDQFYVLGYAMNGGNATSDVHMMWAGDARFKGFIGGLADAGRSLDQDGATVLEVFQGGSYEVFDGDAAQELTDAAGAATCEIAQRMIDDSDPAIAGTAIPGYRGYISIGLFATGGFRWSMGPSPTLPAYSFEASSYVDSDNYPAVGIYARIGYDLNPANALWDLLKAKHGKAGIDPTVYIDSTSFSDAAVTLYEEDEGYSRFINRSMSLDQHIAEILKQIDGVIYVDETDKKYKLKLIRNDYVVRDLPHITKDNGCDLKNFAIGGWTNLVNKVRIVYSNRDRDYNDDSAIAFNTANAAGQDGIVTEQVIQMPGVCDPDNADRKARRELAARSRPIMKCTAYVDRSFVRVNPGDAVKVTWSDPDISGLVFRVASVKRGTVENGKIELSLIQDYYYTYRQVAPQPPGLDHPDIGQVHVKVML